MKVIGLKLKWIISLLILLLVFGSILYFYLPAHNNKKPEMVHVEKNREIVAATGKVEGWTESDLGSKIPGRISEIKVKEGDHVRKGDPIVILDKGDLIARKKEAMAELEQVIADLDKYSNLYRNGIIPKRDLEIAETRYKKALSIIDQINAAIDDTVVRAPFSGRIVKKHKEIGETVGSLTSSDYILKIVDVSRMKVRAEVEESDIGKVALGQKAIITTDAYPGVEFIGDVIKIGQSVGKKKFRSEDPRELLDTKVIETEIELKDIEKIRDMLKIGMTVEVKINR